MAGHSKTVCRIPLPYQRKISLYWVFQSALHVHLDEDSCNAGLLVMHMEGLFVARGKTQKQGGIEFCHSIPSRLRTLPRAAKNLYT